MTDFNVNLLPSTRSFEKITKGFKMKIIKTLLTSGLALGMFILGSRNTLLTEQLIFTLMKDVREKEQKSVAILY